jgi:hypothetical protein
MDAKLRAELLRRVEKDQAARRAGDWSAVMRGEAGTGWARGWARLGSEPAHRLITTAE